MRLILLILFIQLIATAQIKDSDGKRISQASFLNGKSQSTVKLLSGRGLIFTEDVKINGNDVGVFIIDTGSNVSMIDSEILYKLSINESLQGLSDVDDLRKFRFHRLKSIQIGDFQVSNHLIYAGKISPNYPKFNKPVVGVIGGDILGKRPFTLNLNRFTLSFYEKSSFKPIGESHSIKIKNKLSNLSVFSDANPQAGVPVIYATINQDIHEEFLLDTAEPDEVILRSNSALRNKQLAGSYRLPNIIRKPGSSLLQFNALIKNLQMPGIEINRKLKFSYILFPREGFIQEESQIGNKVFQNTIMSFNYKEEKMWLTRFPQDPLYLKDIDFAAHNSLARAVKNGNLDKVKKLIQKPDQINFKGLKGETLMMLAVEGKNAAVIDLLIKEFPTQINAHNHAGVTALMRAAAANQVLMVENLLSSKAHVNRPDIDGMTALHYSILGGSLVVMDKLINAKSNVNLSMKNGMTPLSLASAEGNKQLYMNLIKAGAKVNFLDKIGRTLIHMAAYGNNPELLELVINHRDSPQIDTPAKNGMTPLMIAVKNKKLNSVKVLLNNGASPKAMNSKDFTTALDHAYKSKDKEIIKLIEEAWIK